MEAIASSIGLLAAAGTALGWAQGRERSARRARRHLSLDAVRQGIALMTVMQQHRGMAAALLSGDTGFAVRLADKQREVEGRLAELGACFARVPALAAGGRRLEAIRAAWTQLCQEVRGYTAEQSFAVHTALVQQVLYLLGDIGERGGLLEARSPAVAALAEVLLLRLPLLAESIGQARALGTGFAAQGRCGAVGRIRLSLLERRIGECLAGLGVVLDSPSLVAPAQRCRQQVWHLSASIEADLIGVERITLAPDAYFRCATEAIDACLALWQAAEQVTRRALP
ncbi:nitrate- and nitrite sensing domain-containing protein [Pseudogulbenkiania sp. MAI-1]|uniref:nitrate- and nitrite sensing domain-containing protein n=1 Tax=Pseudogulbenkiania sp. MAI-1 TaxID=990370 RepID=UPI00045E7830|nr:nitrate- and nitrite sensing domain-containing protein [Pseudogulbenkiania sp. MAI-1]